MTCCGCATWTVLMTSGPNCLAIGHRAVERRPVGRGARQHDAAVDRADPQIGVRKALPDLGLDQRGVVHHLDVEHADQLLALGIDRDARGAVLLAEDRERAVGQRIDVGDLRIADRDVDEAGVGAHVLGLADIDLDRRRALVRADLDHALGLRLDGAQQRNPSPRSAPPRSAAARTAAAPVHRVSIHLAFFDALHVFMFDLPNLPRISL